MEQLATKIAQLKKNIILVYAFNGTGKTRLSVAYKNITKKNNKGNHAGVYYNAYSEDLFVWDNDEENNGQNIRLMLQSSTLNQYHQLLDEDKLREHLTPYKPKFDFRFHFYSNAAQGIEYVQFFVKRMIQQEKMPHKKTKIPLLKFREASNKYLFGVFSYFV